MSLMVLLSSCKSKKQAEEVTVPVERLIYKISNFEIPGFKRSYQNKEQLPDLWVGMFSPVEENPSFKEVQLQLVFVDSMYVLNDSTFMTGPMRLGPSPYSGNFGADKMFISIHEKKKLLKGAFQTQNHVATAWIELLQEGEISKPEREYLMETMEEILENWHKYLNSRENPES